MDAAAWDGRYAAAELLWSGGPNASVAAECADLVPGRAFDLAAGEGRNAIWLASRGWDVTALDFSPVAVDRGSRLPGADAARWVVGDVLTWSPPAPVDLVVVAYLHLPREEHVAVVRAAVGALAPGATLLWVAHDRSNVREGVGGPQDPDLLPTAEELSADARAAARDLGVTIEVVRAERIRRRVEPGHRHAAAGGTAYDCLVRLRRDPVT